MGFVVDKIRKRLHEENKNALILLVGDTGSGKSWAALRLAKLIDPSFTPKRVAHQRGSHFMRIIKNQKLKRGDAVIWDDVGKGLKKRDWYDIVNKMIVDVLQTFRVLGLCVIFTCPDPRLIDSNALALFHYWGEMIMIDMRKKQSRMKFFEVQINRRTGKVYWHYLRSYGKPITRLWVKKPHYNITRQYEKDKLPVVMETIRRTAKTVEKVEEKQKLKIMTDKQIVNEVVKNSEQYIKTYNKRTFLDKYAIMSTFGVGGLRAARIKQVAGRKLDI